MSHDTYPQPAEFDPASTLAISALMNAYREWEKLTPEIGRKAVGDNQFKEEAMEADRASELGMLAAVRATTEPTLWLSEEHGRLEINYDSANGEVATNTVVADGVDGSSNMARDWLGGNYGAIFTRANTANPTYNDWQASGIMHFTSGKLYLASHGAKGVLVRNLHDNSETTAFTNQEERLTPLSVMRVTMEPAVSPDHVLYEFYAQGNRFGETLTAAGYTPVCSGSTAGDIIDVATGNAVFDLAATRKGNLELIAERALVQSAGGVMYALERDESARWIFVELGDKKFLEYAQDAHVPILAAANESIAQHALDVLNAKV